MHKMLLMLPFIALAACGSPHGSVCEHAAACGRGGDREREACIAEHDAEQEVGDIYGCSEHYDRYIDCLDEFGVCTNDGNLGGCGAQHKVFHDCVEAGEIGKANTELKAAD